MRGKTMQCERINFFLLMIYCAPHIFSSAILVGYVISAVRGECSCPEAEYDLLIETVAKAH